MDVRYVQAVLEVAATRNMAHAAANLNLSQPALSRQIQTVERELGVVLFNRTGRGMRLSDAGKSLLERCSALIRSESSLREAAGIIRGDVGILSIGATPQTIERLVAPFLKHFRRDYPDVPVHIVDAGGAEVFNLVETNQLRVAVAVAGISDRLVQHPLANMRLLAIQRRSRRDATATRASMTLDEACRYPILALRPSFGSRRLFDSTCELEGLRPNHVFETSAPDAALAMAAAGQGLAVLPSSVDLRGTGLRAIPLVTSHDRLLTLQLVAAYDPARPNIPYVMKAVEGLADLARQISY